MTGWIVENTSSCGVRMMNSRLRRAITKESVKIAVHGRRAGGSRLRSVALMPHPAGSGGPCAASPRRLGRGAASGQREEHVVERRAAQADGRSARCRARPAARTALIRSVAPWCTGSVMRRSPASMPARRCRCRAARPPRRSSASASSRCSSRTSAPMRALSSRGVPLAMTWPWSMTTMWSARLSASSRYWVVSSTRGAVGDELADEAPDVIARLRVEPGRGFVEDQQARPSDEARTEVEPAAHAAGVAAHDAGRRRR